MLINKEYYWACVGEECGEIQQEVGKILRFGATVGRTSKVYQELHDLIATIELATGESVEIHLPLLEEKKEKVIKWQSA
jgi:hypothetical protein